MHELDGYEHQAKRVGLVNPMDYVERCACGNEIRAARKTEEELTRAIVEEHATDRHRAWRKAEGIA